MQRLLAIAAAVAAALTLAGPAAAAGSSSVAALQVALRAHGHYPAAVDGVDGPAHARRPDDVPAAHGPAGQRRVGAPPGRRSAHSVGRSSASASSVSALSAGTSRHSSSSSSAYGLSPAAVDGRFTRRRPRRSRASSCGADLRPTASPASRPSEPSATVHAAVVRAPPRPTHVVAAGESFFSIARALRRQPPAACEGERPEALGRDRPGSAADPSSGCCATQGRANAGVRRLPRRCRRYARRSTTGRPSTASIRGSHARLRGWSPGSRRMSSRTSAPSA